ncbi:Hypothetical protein HDN1F_11170 [gamma proteobacterium HdN1]|nr:Hypothetical protein HDN1F_11170 [gamma proteobacterium HdN1]
MCSAHGAHLMTQIHSGQHSCFSATQAASYHSPQGANSASKDLSQTAHQWLSRHSTVGGRIDVSTLLKQLGTLNASKALVDAIHKEMGASAHPLDVAEFDRGRGTLPPTEWDAGSLFKSQFGDIAADKERFHKMMRAIFSSRYDAEKAESMRLRAAAGDYSFMPSVKFLDNETIQGGVAAYSKDDNVIYLNSAYRDNPEMLESYFVEEAGHFLDEALNLLDTDGDEGELFRRVMAGEALSQAEIDSIRGENDHGTLKIEGRDVAVEFGKLNAPIKAAKKRKKKGLHGLKKGLKKIRKQIKKDFNKIREPIRKAWHKVKDYIATHSWAQSLIRAVAQFYGGPIGAMAAGAFIAYCQGAKGWDILKAGAISGAMSYMSGGMGGAASSSIGGVVANEVKNYAISKVTENIGDERLRGLANMMLTSAASGNFIAQQLMDQGKQAVINTAKAEAGKWVGEKLGDKNAQLLVNAWINSGGNMESLKNELIKGGKDALINKAAEHISDPTLRNIVARVTQNAVNGTASNDELYSAITTELQERVKEEALQRIDNEMLQKLASAWLTGGGDVNELRDIISSYKDKLTDTGSIQNAINSIRGDSTRALAASVANQVFEYGTEALSGDRLKELASREANRALTHWANGALGKVENPQLRSLLSEWAKSGMDTEVLVAAWERFREQASKIDQEALRRLAA